MSEQDPDRAEEINLDFMDCPSCGSMAEIGTMKMFTELEKTVFTWRTLCLEGHFLDNYWFTTEACDDERDEFKSDVTDL